MKKELINIVKSFDLFGLPMNIHIYGKEKLHTSFTAFMTIITILSTLSISLVFIVSFLKKEEINVITNRTENFYPIINLSKTPIMFALSTDKAKILNPNKLFNFTLEHTKYINHGKDGVKVANIPLEIEKCNKTKHFQDRFELINEIRFDTYN